MTFRKKIFQPLILAISLQAGLAGLSVTKAQQAQNPAANPPAKGLVTPDITKSLLEGKQGQIINLPGFLTEKLDFIPYRQVVLPGPQFLISDDPEYIRVPEGIAMQEKVQPGTVRVYLYNVNGVKEPAKIDRKITTLIKNMGSSVLHIRMLKFSSQKPTGSYFLAGKQGLADFFASKPENATREVKPGEAIAIDPAYEKHIVRYDELAHGIYEFVIDQPAEINVIQTDPSIPGPKALARMKGGVLPSGHQNAGRGIFGVSNYQIITGDKGPYDTQNGVAQLVVADGRLDPWVVGKQSGTDKIATLDGNYGVMYNIDLNWKSSDGKGLALVTWNARADGQWCGGMATSMVTSKGKFPAGIVQLPSDRLITKRDPEAILIQVFPPSPDGKEQTLHLTYSPPGASCLPTPLIFIPVDMKDVNGK